MNREPRERKELVLPPAQVIGQSRLCLQEHFTSEAERAVLVSTKFFKLPVGMLTHTWISTENYEKVVRWLEDALLAAQRDVPVHFFTDPAIDSYHYDRALHATAVTGKDPVRVGDIPRGMWRKRQAHDGDERPKGSRSVIPLGTPDIDIMGILRSAQSSDHLPAKDPNKDWYRYEEVELSWRRGIPITVTNETGAVLRAAPPDAFWIAKYLSEHGKLWYSAVYARFGYWEVEVARWEE